jgi:hypothetical protein
MFVRDRFAVDQCRAGGEYLLDHVDGSSCGSHNMVPPVDLALPTITECEIIGKNLKVLNGFSVIQRGEPLTMIFIESVVHTLSTLQRVARARLSAPHLTESIDTCLI